jgi:two-component system phosphate regulon sensor histidine kinase PhoR
VLRSLFAVLAALLVFGSLCAWLLQRQYLDDRREEIKSVFRTLTVSGIDGEYGALAKKLSQGGADGLRVTFISPSGKVLGDSAANPDEMENHLSRPEVAAAKKSGYGEDTRYSATVKSRMFYAAERLPDGTILRLAVSMESLSDHVWSLLPALLAAMLLAIAIVPPLVMRMSKSILKPLQEIVLSLQTLNAGGYGKDLSPPRYEEFVPIVDEINTLSRKISHTLSDLTVERRRIRYLIDNMTEGMAVLDNAGRILILNRSAASFFGAKGDLVGQDLLCLTRDPKITGAAQLAMREGKASVFDLPATVEKRLLRISVTPVAKEKGMDQSGGIILLITDVTAVRRSEQIRSEFFANASHELKTPLTSIKGFAELMETGIVNDPAQTKRYLELIRQETERMIGLISDILKLSELESRASEIDRKSVSLLMIARKVAESLAVQAQEKQVEVRVEGNDGFLDANPDRMTQLVLNLLDNAVKYNVQGGRADVFVRTENDRVILTVADTGVGIPKEAQERVFERFYRVDKSRSRRLGGTGLGLSIVKHIVGLYKGKIRLRSEPGKGTEITVTLPVGP